MHPERLRCYQEPVTLEDGGVISVRAIRPSDKPLILGLFHSMGPDSIRHRVFASKSELTESELAYLTELDFVRHVALVATAVSVEGAEEILGVARYCR
ncbi:MAG: GNAT family N-acetyltransferase, partial [Polyangiaceae bacterium]